MTEELLKQGNALKMRIKDVSKLIESLDLTDPSGVDNTIRTSPIMIQAGMAQTIQFDILPADIDAPITEMQKLDANIYNTIVEILKSYKNQLETMFTSLA